MALHIYTIIHVLISLIGIFTGFFVLFGMLKGERLDGWTKWFLITTAPASPAFSCRSMVSRRLMRAWRERNNLSQSEAALKLQISKRTLQEWEQNRVAPRALREPQSKKPFVPSAATQACWRMLLYVNHV